MNAEMSQLSNLLVVFVWFVWVGWMVVVVVVVAWTILNSQDPRLWISPPKKNIWEGFSHCWESQEKSPNNPRFLPPKLFQHVLSWQALDILEAILWEAYTQAVQLGVKVGSGFDRLNRTHRWWGIKEAAKSMVKFEGFYPKMISHEVLGC